MGPSECHHRSAIGRLIVPIAEHSDFHEFLPDDVSDLLKWLNQPFDYEVARKISMALRKTEFRIRAKRSSDIGYKIKTERC